jgi:hypothetical protein
MAIKKRNGSFEITIQWAMGIIFSPTVKKAKWRGKYFVLYGMVPVAGWVDNSSSPFIHLR